MPSATRANTVYWPSSAGWSVMQMKNCEPALSRRPGTSTADTAPRVCFSAFGLEAQHAEAAGAVLRRLRRILRDRIAALDDAHRDHAMERRPVVGALARARDEVRDVVRRRVRQQVEHDRPVRRLEHGLLVLQLGRRQRRGEERLARRAGALRGICDGIARITRIGAAGMSSSRAAASRIICYASNGVERSCSIASRQAPMYEEFYGFVQPPFTLAPDPRFLYRSESHDEAITRPAPGDPPPGRLHRPDRRHRHRQDDDLPRAARAARPDDVHVARPQPVPLGRGAAARDPARLRRRLARGGAERAHRRGHQARAHQHAARVPAVADRRSAAAAC